MEPTKLRRRRLLWQCQRADRPRRSYPADFDLLEILRPGLSVIRRTIGAPGEAVGPDVGVVDPPGGSVRRAHPELLLDVHFIAFAMTRACVLQTASAVQSDELPAIERRVVRADGVRHVVGFIVVADHAILVDEL